MKTKQDVYDFLNAYTTGAISTVNADGKPNAAIIGFGQTKDLQIVFGTGNTTRKYQNIMRDPHVAFAIGGGTPETIQYEGVARELDKSELDIVEATHWKKNPSSKKHAERPTERYFIVMPTWIRYTKVDEDPWVVEEIEV